MISLHVDIHGSEAVVINILRFYIILLYLINAPVNTLVDKEHSLPSWYAPGVNIEAREALDHLIDSIGLLVDVHSEYRSYRDQEDAYLRLVSEEGQERADQVIAHPGHSEHQLGTTFDLSWAGLPVEFNDPRNRELWRTLEEHAHEFGFVISYPFKQVGEWPFDNSWYPIITEFRWEPWHIRYVGVELATQIFKAGYLDPASPVLPQDFYEPWLE
jgi:D-alanyl-D-alanine carboxypeptidase